MIDCNGGWRFSTAIKSAQNWFSATKWIYYSKFDGNVLPRAFFMVRAIQLKKINYEMCNWKMQPSIWLNCVLKIYFLVIGFIHVRNIKEWVNASKVCLSVIKPFIEGNISWSRTMRFSTQLWWSYPISIGMVHHLHWWKTFTIITPI